MHRVGEYEEVNEGQRVARRERRARDRRERQAVVAADAVEPVGQPCQSQQRCQEERNFLQKLTERKKDYHPFEKIPPFKSTYVFTCQVSTARVFDRALFEPALVLVRLRDDNRVGCQAGLLCG